MLQLQLTNAIKVSFAQVCYYHHDDNNSHYSFISYTDTHALSISLVIQ